MTNTRTTIDDVLNRHYFNGQADRAGVLKRHHLDRAKQQLLDTIIGALPEEQPAPKVEDDPIGYDYNRVETYGFNACRDQTITVIKGLFEEKK